MAQPQSSLPQHPYHPSHHQIGGGPSQQQPSYYVPPQQRPHPSQYYTHSAPSHPQPPMRGGPRYEQRYGHPQDFPDDEYYSDIDYDDGIDDGYYDEEPDTTKDNEKPLSWVWLYVIGLLTCLTIEIMTIVLAYFLDIVIVAPLMCSIWLFATILSLCTLSSILSPSKSQQRTQLCITFLMACAVGIACGLISSVYLKTAWYYDNGNYYQQVNPTIPSYNYPNAVTASFAKGSYVGKDYAGMVIQGNTHYCAAPILGSDHNNQSIPTTFWAIDTDCCQSTNTGVASPGHIATTCGLWSSTNLQGEIRKNPSDSFVSAVFASLSWYQSLGLTSAEERYYIELLSPNEHQSRQQKRKFIGYLVFAIAPICWPIILIFYAMFMAFQTCCFRKQQSTETTY